MQLFAYWHEYPPVHEVLKAAFLVKAKDDKTVQQRPSTKLSAEAFRAYKDARPGGFIRGGLGL